MANDRNPPSAYSGKWFRTLSDAELQDIYDGNMPGGMAFDGASAELDRRQAARDQKRQLFWIKLAFWSAFLLGIGGITATLLS
jgi:hypothetical protein